MVIKAKKGLYDNLSRKELQSMCGLYGLPPNKKSLLAFSQERINGLKCSSEKCLSPENECRDVVSSSTFQLYVRSEDGLNLYVDLNSSLSDWTEKFKREIHILENGNENVQQSKSWSLHDGLVCPKDYENEFTSSEENIHQHRPGMMPLDPFSVDASMESQPQSCHVISVADFCAIDPPEGRKFTDDDPLLPNPRFDASGMSCDNGEPVGYFDNKESGLTNSTESNHLPVSAEERERSNILSERESSESSQFTKTSDKACFGSGYLDGGHQRKRKRVEAEHHSDYAQPNVKVLRSMKRKKDLPRRSMRLMSK